jgi:hypothetical protein
MQTELMAIVVLKALAELAAMFLVGRGALYVLAGEKRDQNLFYQILCVVTSPIVRLTRLITPKVVIDRHIPWAALLVVVWIWLGVVFVWLPDACASRVDCSDLIERKRSG